MYTGSVVKRTWISLGTCISTVLLHSVCVSSLDVSTYLKFRNYILGMVSVYDSSSLKVICQGKMQLSRELCPSFEQEEDKVRLALAGGVEKRWHIFCLSCCRVTSNAAMVTEYTAWSLPNRI